MPGLPATPSLDHPTKAADTKTAAVQDSVEEVLHQTSDNVLRLTHLEELTAGLAQGVNDLREELQAAFTEIRTVLDQHAAASQPNPAESSLMQSVSANVESVETESHQIRSRQGLLTALCIAQLVALVVVIFMLWGARKQIRSEILDALPATPTPVVTAPALPAVERPVAPPSEPAAPGKKAKRGHR